MTTTKRRVSVAALAAGVLLGGMSACGDPEPADPDTTRVVVDYRDTSLEPEYHRSWTLTLDQDRIHLVVDSYGDVVAEETAAMPAEEWEEFAADLPQDVEELGDPEDAEDGCAGGNGIELTATGGADISFDLDNCNTEDGDEAIDEIEEMVEPFTDLVHLDQHTHIN